MKGFLDPLEGERLQDLAQQVSRTAACLEVGSYCGKSTAYLGKGCAANNGILYAVDHHRGSEEHQRGEEYHDAELFDQQLQVIDSFREFRKTIRAASLEKRGGAHCGNIAGRWARVGPTLLRSCLSMVAIVKKRLSPI